MKTANIFSSVCENISAGSQTKKHSATDGIMPPLWLPFNVGDNSSRYPVLPALLPALAENPAAYTSPPGFRPPPPSALAKVGAVPSGVKMRDCWVSHGFMQFAINVYASFPAARLVQPTDHTNPVPRTADWRQRRSAVRSPPAHSSLSAAARIPTPQGEAG